MRKWESVEPTVPQAYGAAPSVHNRAPVPAGRMDWLSPPFLRTTRLVPEPR